MTLRDPKSFRVTPNRPQLGLIRPPSLGKAGVRTGDGSLDQQHPSVCQQEGFGAAGAVGENNCPKFLPTQEGGVTTMAPRGAPPGEEARFLVGLRSPGADSSWLTGSPPVTLKLSKQSPSHSLSI